MISNVKRTTFPSVILAYPSAKSDGLAKVTVRDQKTSFSDRDLATEPCMLCAKTPKSLLSVGETAFAITSASLLAIHDFWHVNTSLKTASKKCACVFHLALTFDVYRN